MSSAGIPKRTPPGQRSLCEGISDAYSIGLHSGAIVAVLFASLIGTLLPLITLFVPMLRNNPFVFVIAKTAATGVLLSVSTIHLLGDGISAFEEPCIPEGFYNAYPAYHLLFMLIAALTMHYIDLKMVSVGERWMQRRNRNRAKKYADGGADADTPRGNGAADDDDDRNSASGSDGGGDAKKNAAASKTRGNGGNAVAAGGSCVHASAATSASHGAAAAAATAGDDDCAVCDAVRAMDASTCGCAVRAVSSTAAPTRVAKTAANGDAVASGEADEDVHSQHSSGGDNAHAHAHDAHDAHDDHSHHLEVAGHSHGVVIPPEDMSQLRRVIAAVCMEFGVTLHSLFVGLDIGLATDRSLKPLLIALVFHQLFEGMSMGSRLVDAKFNLGLEVVLALVFSFSAPLGMTAATIAASVRPDALSGTSFVLMMGVLDSMCAGILLYLAFNLLFIDFDAEMRVHCAPGRPRRGLKRCVMFTSLWFGMLLMALIGKWC